MIRAEAEDPATVYHSVEPNDPVGIADGELDSGQSVTLYHVNDSIGVQLQLPTAGSFRLAARLRSGGKDNATAYWPNGYRFQLDGQLVTLRPDLASVSPLDSRYGGCHWGTMVSDTLTLGAGPHVFEITALATWAVADYVEAIFVGPAEPTKEAVAAKAALPALLHIEAETKLVVAAERGSNGTVGVADGTLDSGQSVRLYDVGDAVRLTLTIRPAGIYRLDVRVRCGGETGPTDFWPDGYKMLMDGKPVPIIGVPASVSDWDTAYGGCTWGTMRSSSIVLTEGRHDVEISAQAEWGVLDYVDVVALQPMGAFPVVAAARPEKPDAKSSGP